MRKIETSGCLRQKYPTTNNCKRVKGEGREEEKEEEEKEGYKIFIPRKYLIQLFKIILITIYIRNKYFYINPTLDQYVLILIIV